MEKFLRCMPKRYEQLVFSIETLLDLQDLSIDDVAGRFKVVEDREHASESEQGKLLYSETRPRAARSGVVVPVEAGRTSPRATVLAARPIPAADAVIVEVTPAANAERAATTPATTATTLGTGLKTDPSRGEIAVPHMLRRETSTSASSSRTAPSS